MLKQHETTSLELHQALGLLEVLLLSLSASIPKTWKCHGWLQSVGLCFASLDVVSSKMT
jgi:hypothetical protein